MNHKIRGAKFYLLTFLTTFFLYGCSSSPTSPPMTDAELINSLEEVDRKLYGEERALIALKYGIEIGVFEKLLKEYNHKTSILLHSPDEQLSDQNKNASIVKTKTAIESLADEYQIAPNKIAALLIDYSLVTKENEPCGDYYIDEPER